MTLPTTPSATPSKARQRGFTLIEMLVTLGIIALLVAVAAPRIGMGSTTARAQGAAEEVAAQLRSTRASAMASGRPTDFIVDVARGTFASQGSRREIAVPDEIHLALFTADGAITGKSTGAIRFYPDGGSTGGGVAVQSGPLHFTVAVDWLTGSVSLRRQAPERDNEQDD